MGQDPNRFLALLDKDSGSDIKNGEGQMIRKLISIAFLIALSGAATLAQEKQPNFSGNWTLNVSKSDFGVLGGPDKRTDVITHKEAALTDEVSAEGAQGKQQYTIKYTTDGKEVTNQINGREVKSTLKWDGPTLVITSTLTFNDNPVDVRATWALSADGKTLTISAHYASAMGETDQKLVLEKQEPAAVPAKTP